MSIVLSESFHLKVCFDLIFHLKMMTDKLILILLIFFVSSSVDSLKLENICEDGVFEYNGLEVNSFYKIPQHVGLDLN